MLSAFGAIGESDISNSSQVIMCVCVCVFICVSANACRRHITPYFSKIIEVLNSFIYAQYSQENSLLQSQAVGRCGLMGGCGLGELCVGVVSWCGQHDLACPTVIWDLLDKFGTEKLIVKNLGGIPGFPWPLVNLCTYSFFLPTWI